MRSSRLIGIIAMFLVLVVLEIGAPDLFTPVVAVVLVVSPIINFRAWWLLRHKHRTALALGKTVRSLDATYLVSGFLLVASVSLAAAGVVTLLRLAGVIDPLGPVLLVLLSFPLLLMVGPAIEWLIAFQTWDVGDGQSDR